MEGGLEGVVFGIVGEAVEGGEIAELQDDGLGAGLGGEGDEDAAVLGVGGVFVAGHPEGGAFGFLVLFIEDGEDVAGAAGLFEEVEFALDDQGAGGDAVADEFDHVGAALA